MLRLKSLSCSSCGAPLSAKKRDLVLVCKKCENTMEFYSGEVAHVDARVARFNSEKGGEKAYIPFWVNEVDLNVKDKKIVGGRIGRFIKGQKEFAGRMNLWVCAADIEDKLRKEWNMNYTLNPPSFTEQNGFEGIGRLPVVLNKEGAGHAAEFLFIRHEVEISGTLQRLDYDFTIHNQEIIYLPFYKSSSTYISGL